MKTIEIENVWFCSNCGEEVSDHKEFKSDLAVHYIMCDHCSKYSKLVPDKPIEKSGCFKCLENTDKSKCNSKDDTGIYVLLNDKYVFNTEEQKKFQQNILALSNEKGRCYRCVNFVSTPIKKDNGANEYVHSLEHITLFWHANLCADIVNIVGEECTPNRFNRANDFAHEVLKVADLHVPKKLRLLWCNAGVHKLLDNNSWVQLVSQQFMNTYVMGFSCPLKVSVENQKTHINPVEILELTNKVTRVLDYKEALGNFFLYKGGIIVLDVKMKEELFKETLYAMSSVIEVGSVANF